MREAEKPAEYFSVIRQNGEGWGFGDSVLMLDGGNVASALGSFRAHTFSVLNKLQVRLSLKMCG